MVSSRLRPFRHRPSSRARQPRLGRTRRLTANQLFDTPIRINRWRVVRHQSAGIRRRPIIAMQLMPKHPQHRTLLPAMMRGVRDAASHDPFPRALHIEKRRVFFPPRIVFPSQHRQSLPAILRITPDELHPRLRIRQWRRAHINPQHRPKPNVLAGALMHHLLVDASPPRISHARPKGKFLIPKLAPHAHHLDSLGLVRLHQKIVSHRMSPLAWN